DFVQRRGGRIRREVTAEAVEAVVRAVDHDGRGPTDERPDAAREVLVAPEPRLLFGRDRVDVVRLHHQRDGDALLAGAFHQPREEIVRPGLAPDVDDRVERLQPLGGLLPVDVRQLVDRSVDEHAASVSTPYRLRREQSDAFHQRTAATDRYWSPPGG